MVVVIRLIILHCACLGLQMLSMVRFLAKINILLEMNSLTMVDLAASSGAVNSAAKRCN